MFEHLFNQFVIAFREGIEASLIIMTVLLALKKRGDKRLTRAAHLGIYTAVAACIGAGSYFGASALTRSLGHDIEASLYGAAAVTVVTMVFWMRRTGRKLKGNIESKLDSAQSAGGLLPLLGVFSFVFFMIAREGFEMMLLLLAFGEGVGGSYFVGSMLLGILAAVGVSYALSKGLVRINIGKFLHSTSYVLMLFSVQLVFDVLHELGEGGHIMSYGAQWIANFIDYVHDQVQIFSYAGLALFLVIVIYQFAGGAKSPRLSRPAASA